VPILFGMFDNFDVNLTRFKRNTYFNP